MAEFTIMIPATCFTIWDRSYNSSNYSNIIPSTNAASRMRLHHSLPFHIETSVWIFFFGQFSIQRLQRMHSPERQPSSSRNTPVGQFRSQRLHPFKQCSRSRDNAVHGSAGRNAKTAPIGQRN